MTPGSRDSLQKPIPVTASSSDTDFVLGLDPWLAKAWIEQADRSYVMGGPVLELAEEELRALDSMLLMFWDNVIVNILSASVLFIFHKLLCLSNACRLYQCASCCT